MPQSVRWLWLTLGFLAVTALSFMAFGNLLVLLALAGLLAAGLWPLVSFLERHGLSHPQAVGLTLLGVALSAATVVALLVPPLIRQVAALADALPAYAAALPQLGGQWTALEARFSFLPSLAEVTAWITRRASAYLQSLLGLVGQVVALATSLLTLFLLLNYMLHDGRSLREQALLLVPPHHRDETRAVLNLLAERVGRFTLGTATDMAIVGGVTAVGFWLIGVPNALVLGLIVGLFNLLPFIGATLGAIPALIVAFGISPQLGLLALLVVMVVQQLEGSFIYPRVVGHAVGLSPFYILIVVIAGTQLWGAVGVFLAIPAAVVIKTLLEAWVVPRIQRMAPPPEARSGIATEPGRRPTITFAPNAIEEAAGHGNEGS